MKELKINYSSLIRYSFMGMLIVAVIASLSIIFGNSNSDYSLLWILPTSYFIFSLIFFRFLTDLNYNIGFILFATLLCIFMRFVIMPFSMLIFNQYNSWGTESNPQKSSLDTAMILMTLELLAVYIAVFFVCKYFSKKQYFSKTDIDNDSKAISSEYRTLLSGENRFLKLFILFFLPLTIIFNFQAYQIFGLIEFNLLGDDFVLEGAVTLLTDAVKIATLFWVLSIIYKQSKKEAELHGKTNARYIAYSWCSVIVYVATNSSTSRATLVFSLLCIAYILQKLYPNTSKYLYMAIALCAFIALVVISMTKFKWLIHQSEYPIFELFKSFFKMMQEYFQGPRNIALALEMKHDYGDQLSINTLINDFLGSIPGVSNFIDQTNRSNFLFNQYIGRKTSTRIVPTTGVGMIYIPFFPMFFAVISNSIVVIIDYYYKKINKLEFLFPIGFFGFYMAINMVASIQSLVTSFICDFIVVFSLFAFNLLCSKDFSKIGDAVLFFKQKNSNIKK